jgi:hypothetical protein
MRRLQKLAALLYPPKWRARYGPELNALLEDLDPQPGDLIDLFFGAIHMHMKEWSYLKFAAVFAVAGLLAGGIVLSTMPDQYLSRALVSIPSEREWVRAQVPLFSRSVLKTVIEEQNLYAYERQRQPLEDVIETMRTRDLRFKFKSPSKRELTFLYPDAGAARRTVQSLISSLEEHPQLRTLGLASLSERVSPNRGRIFAMCFGVALLLGILTAAAIRTPGRTVLIVVASGIVGGTLFGVGSFLLQERYLSQAMLMSSDGELLQGNQLTDERLATAIHDGMFGVDKKQTVPTAALIKHIRQGLSIRSGRMPGGTPWLFFRYVSGNPRESQAIVQSLTAMEVNSSSSKAGKLEVIDKASFSESPIGPNHLVFAGIGVGLGFIAGFLHTRVKAPRRAPRQSDPELQPA